MMIPFVAVIALLLAVTALAPIVMKALGARGFALLALAPAAGFALFLTAPSGDWAMPWVPSLGIELAFRLDGLSRMFALLITGLGTLILLYSAGYFSPKYEVVRFSAAFMGFMTAMLGLVLSDDILGLFVFWELTSITSYLLIGYHHEKEDSRKGAQQAFLITGAGGLAMLVGMVMLAQGQGTWRISEFTAVDPQLGAPIFWLILIGCATKSAQFPFHFWLPNAMAAPTPVSAFLHSATMVKAGVFLLARLRPTLESRPEWVPTLSVLGGLTVFTALLLVFWHRDLKKLLAYTTIGALGMLVFLLGQSGGAGKSAEYAQKAFVALVVGHALYKGAFFLIAGLIDKATGTRDALEIKGLGRSHPILGGVAGLAALSSLGLVGFLGFQGKEYAILAGTGNLPALVVVAAFAVGGGLVATRLAWIPFWTGSASHPEAKALPFITLVAPGTLALAGLGVGLAISQTGVQILNPAAEAIGVVAAWEWKVFPGFNWAFFTGLALAALSVGVGFAWRPQEAAPFATLNDRWHRLISQIPSLAAVPTRWIQGGRLRDYFAMFFGVITATVLVVMFGIGGWRLPADSVVPLTHEVVIVSMSLLAVVAVLVARKRVVAICVLGVVGTGIGILFLAFGAPDLAMTQLLTELLTIILAVLVIHRLPKFRSLSTIPIRIRDGVIAISFGLSMMLLVLVVQNADRSDHVMRYFANNAVEKAYGSNVVNTILVDFRAMDTLGEIVVLAVAALGVYALMNLRIGREEE